MRVELEPQNFNGVRGVKRDFMERTVVYYKPGTLVRLAPNWGYVAKPISDEPEVEVNLSVEALARRLAEADAQIAYWKEEARLANVNLDNECKRRIQVEAELRLNQRQAKLAEKYLAQAKAGLLRIIEDDEGDEKADF